jgi:hypothetical protein
METRKEKKPIIKAWIIIEGIIILIITILYYANPNYHLGNFPIWFPALPFAFIFLLSALFTWYFRPAFFGWTDDWT